jgi:UDP:flavonoid glycosyltransferase YjiC (YdhE family)
VRPDVVVEDNVVSLALMTSGARTSASSHCNPLEVPGDDLPPAYSGLPVADRSGWESFRAGTTARTPRPVVGVRRLGPGQGAPPLPDLEFVATSEHAGLVFPEEADYTGLRPLDATWHRMDSSVRRTDEPTSSPRRSPTGEGSALVYLSLGSLGSADVELMKRLVDVLGQTPHRYIVSKGPQHDQYELADNMVGAEFTAADDDHPAGRRRDHARGGNNTTTEALHFAGRP